MGVTPSAFSPGGKCQAADVRALKLVHPDSAPSPEHAALKLLKSPNHSNPYPPHITR